MKELSKAEVDRLQTCACMNLRAGARAVTRLYERHLRPTGLNATQFSSLGALQYLREAIPLTTLADRLDTDHSTLSRTVRPLIDEGLIAVETGDDARVRNLRITAKGQRRLAAAYPHWAAAQAEVEEAMGNRYATTVGQLRKVRQHVRES